MDEDIVIEVKLEDRELNRQIEAIESKFKRSLNAAFGGSATSGATSVTRAIKDQEAAALRLAQAQARLAAAGGNLTGAQTVLSNALSKTTRETVAQIGAQTQLVRVNQQMQRETQQSASAVSALGRSTAGVVAAFSALAAIGVASFFESVARRAVDAAISIDQQVTALTALTGSATAAKQRLEELFALSQKTPGLTLGLASTLDAQLRVFDVNTQTINKLLDTVGRLNAISPLGDPRQFSQNLIQLVTQNFERQDLKELVRQSPIAGQLLKEVFNVDSPINAEAIRASAKKLGITTVERLAEELAKAGAENPALRNAIEGLGTRFERLQDRLTRALAPVGTQLAEIGLQLGDDLVKQVEKYGNAAARVFEENKGQIIATGREIVALGVEFTKLIAGIATSPQLQELLGKLTSESARTQDLLQATGSQRAKILFGIEQGPRERAALERQRSIVATGETVSEFSARLQRESKEMLDRLEGRAPSASGTKNGGGGGGGGISGISGARSREKTELEKAREETKRVRERVTALESETSALVRQKLELLQLKLREDELDKALADRAFRELLKSQGKPLPPQLPDIGLVHGPTGKFTPFDVVQRGIPLRPALGSPGAITGRPTVTFQSDIDAQAASAARTGADLADARLRVQEVQIQNQLNRGLLTEAEAQRALNAARRAGRDELISKLEAERESLDVNSLRGLQITEEIERLRFLGQELSLSERFMRGFNSAVEDVGDSFERFAQNVSNAFRNVRDLFNGLKSAVLGFFNDLIGNSLQNLVRQTLGGLLGGGGGILGNLFRTPSFAGGGNAFQGLTQAIAGAAGGGISVPASISAAQTATGIFANGAFGAGLAGTGGGAVAGVAGAATSAASRFSLGGLLGGLSGASPLLGLGIGAGFGGQSVAGQILGAVGGGAIGLGASFGASVFSAAGGGLGALGPAALAALGPIALIGAPLLVGSILLGKAAQRKKDEEASGQFLTQAIQAIQQLAAGVASGQIPGSQAAAIFETQILGTFKQQISGLKTKSVVESRLTNQVNDLRKVYRDLVEPAITAQASRAATSAENAARFARQIPQFASGGTTRGGLALLHAGEKVLNLHQQAAVIRQSNPQVFERAGVPGMNRSGVFDNGGTFAGAGLSVNQPLVIEGLNVSLSVFVGKEDQTRVVINGLSTSDGRAVMAKNMRVLRTDREA